MTEIPHCWSLRSTRLWIASNLTGLISSQCRLWLLGILCVSSNALLIILDAALYLEDEDEVCCRIHFATTPTRELLNQIAPCGLWGCKNRPAPFPGRMSKKVTKPGSVCPVS